MEKCRRCKRYSEKYDCAECKPDYKTTNADRIRSMNDEELADWVYTHDCITEKKGRLNKEELINWLQSEAE